MSLTIDVIEDKRNKRRNKRISASIDEKVERSCIIEEADKERVGCSRKRAKRRDGKHIEIYNSRKEERATTLREISISVFKMLHGTPS